jgi:hypothetical protein
MLDPLLQSYAAISDGSKQQQACDARIFGGVMVPKLKSKRLGEIGKTVAAIRAEAFPRPSGDLEIVQLDELPLVLASGLSINIGGADLARLFREIDGKTRGIPSQQGN